MYKKTVEQKKRAKRAAFLLAKLKMRDTDIAAGIGCVPLSVYLWRKGRAPSEVFLDKLEKFAKQKKIV